MTVRAWTEAMKAGRYKDAAAMDRRTLELSTMLPCPFCGGVPGITTVRDGLRVACMTCGALGAPAYNAPKTMPPTRQRAIAAWNDRAQSYPTEEAYEAACAALHKHQANERSLITALSALCKAASAVLGDEVPNPAMGEYVELDQAVRRGLLVLSERVLQ